MTSESVRLEMEVKEESAPNAEKSVGANGVQLRVVVADDQPVHRVVVALQLAYHFLLLHGDHLHLRIRAAHKQRL